MSTDGGRPPGAPKSRSPAARVLGAGARGAERLAGATGVDKAIEDATEEAIVRALRSPAVERAIVRVLVEENAIGRGLEQALTSDEVARAIVNAIDSEVGLVTRALAAVVDLALISALLSIGSGLLASIVPAISGGSDGLSIWGVLTFGVVGFLIGGSIFVAFWALIGQTPGMRFLSIHLDAGGSQEIGLRRALKRILAVPLSFLPLGLGFLAILLSPERRGWHDRIAGTVVVYDEEAKLAPWSQLQRERVSP